MSVVHEQQGSIRATALDPTFLRTPIEQYAETARISVLPLLGRHLGAGRRQPAYIGDIKFFVSRANQKSAAIENWKSLSGGDHLAGEFPQGTTLRADAEPVEPASLVVLGIGVV